MDSQDFVISDVSRLLRRRFDERARLVGITRPQWRVLMVLARHEGTNQGNLAEFLEVEPITLCRMIDRLEEAGHVERRRDPNDRRAWQIFLTDRSRPLLEKLQAIANDLFAAAFNGIAEPLRDAFAETLGRVRSNLSETYDINEANHG